METCALHFSFFFAEANAMKDPHPPLKLRQMLDKAEKLNNRGQHQKAITLLQKLVIHCPDWWAVHYNLGSTLSHLNRWQEAIESLQRALALATTPPWAAILPPIIISWINNNLGKAYCQGLRFHEARQAFERGLAATPDDKTTQENLLIIDEIDKILLEASPQDAETLRSMN
jgi:tetratricopeptide (TPR) repeat protein